MSRVVRIQSTGINPREGSVVDADSGEVIEYVTDVVITLSATTIARAVITVQPPMVDVIVEAEIRKVCPCCGHPIKSAEDE